MSIQIAMPSIRKPTEDQLHLILWGALLILIITSELWGGRMLGSFWRDKDMGITITLILGFPLLFHLNTFWLIPQYLRRRKWLQYLLMLGATVAGFSLAMALLVVGTTLVLDPRVAAGPLLAKQLFNPFLPATLWISLTLSFTYRLIRDWIVNNRMIDKLQAEKLSMELAFLKSQVDPHFLFNTLNSLYGSALEEDSPNTAEGISQLGALMRYNLHDAQATVISLEKEIDYIQKYIALQQLRMTGQNQVSVIISLTAEQLEGNTIVPLMLIPFIENAFKYGVSPTEKTEIKLQISMEKHNLRMQMENTIIREAPSKQGGGVGISNVRQRLQLHYPNRHLLDIQSTETQFSVDLQIQLQA